MKKETIFKHELNERIQADAAMNCLKNRNKHKQINEVAPVVAAAGRMLLPMCDACESVYVSEQEEDITPPWVGRQYNGGIDFDADGNLQVITPDEDDDDDDYEAPPLFDSEQERHDIALATTYCLGESFIDNDGDLDDIYYAVLKVFDSTYDAPATTDYKEVLQWCRKHYKQIESMIY